MGIGTPNPGSKLHIKGNGYPESFLVLDTRGLPIDNEYVGFVAQDVQEVFPEAVSEGMDGYLDFNMHPINVALVNAVKELKAADETLRDKNSVRDQDIEILRAENNILKQEIETLRAQNSVHEKDIEKIKELLGLL